MSKIKEAFAKEKAFIPFITCGDPDLETTEKIIEAMAAAGADLIELRIPFFRSDSREICDPGRQFACFIRRCDDG